MAGVEGGMDENLEMRRHFIHPSEDACIEVRQGGR
jgi:hypothetical protein